MSLDPQAKQKIERLRLEAEVAYQEFLRRLTKLEEERTNIVQDTLKQVDSKKIEEIRKRLGLSAEPGLEMG